ncbi:MAG: mechanosensitive ion channel family protein [Bacteroidia bacterium]|jgi:small-conductance mechanosensitive channel
MEKIFDYFHLSLQNFFHYLPALLGGIFCLLIAFFVSNFCSKIVSKYSLKRTKDPLIANFIGKIVWSVLLILGIVLALGILGLGTVSNKILAGAGITTFVVGFALKDIGENFLSGIILAFSRPYKVGSMIESVSVKGVVKNMTMRQTTIEADNGKIILVPNSQIIKNPLIKYSNDDNHLRQEFYINVPIGEVERAAQLVKETVCNYNAVLKSGNKTVKVIIESLNADMVKLLVIYWLDSTHFNGSKSGTRTDVMFTVFKTLKEAEIKFAG